jgi:hypothetical protein
MQKMLRVTLGFVLFLGLAAMSSFAKEANDRTFPRHVSKSALFQSLHGKTPDGQTPSEEEVCDGLSGPAFGLCNAYCEAQDCDALDPERNSCERLRRNFEKHTGTPIFPCDAACGNGRLDPGEACDPLGVPCAADFTCYDDCTCGPGSSGIPPVADAGQDQNVSTGETVVLDGSGSHDADGDPLTYTWSFTSKPSGSTASLSPPNAVSPSFEADLEGTYVVQLIVHDGAEYSEPDTATVAASENASPVAKAGADRTYQVPPEGTLLVSLDGSGSYDPDGTIVSYVWTGNSDPADVVGPSVALGAGVYTFDLTVTDDQGAFSSDTVVITVESLLINAPPRFLPMDALTVNEGEPLTFQPQAIDPDGDLPAYSAVDLPEGASFSPTSASFFWEPGYDQAGDYTASIRASDGQLEDVLEVPISVVDVNRPPEISPVPDQIIYVGDAPRLRIRASDPDRDLLEMTAARTSGHLAFSIDDEGYGSGSVDLYPSTADIGVHAFRFTVSDGQMSASTDATVTVKGRGEKPDPTLVAETLALVSLEIAPPTVAIGPGEVAQLSAVGHFSDGSSADLTSPASGTTYQMESAGVASVDANGQITGLHNGSTTLLASNSGITARAAVRVGDTPACPAGPFTPPTLFPEPAPDALSLGRAETLSPPADFNEDGFPDVIALHGSGAELFFGDGSTWGPLVELPWITWTWNVNYTKSNLAVVADFDGDGHDDIVGTDAAGNRIGIILGNGDGTFWTDASGSGPFSYIATDIQRPNNLAVADFNGDGWPDLAVASGDVTMESFVEVLLNNAGDGTFSPSAALRLESGYVARSLIQGDVDGDGSSDLFWARAGDDGYVSLNHGDGTFADPTAIPLDARHEKVSVADLDLDGADDLLIAVPPLGFANGPANIVERGYLKAFMDYGPGGFQTTVTTPSADHEIFAQFVLSDVDGDGIADVFIDSVAWEWETWVHWDILFLEGRGDGSFEEGNAFGLRSVEYEPVGFMDLNADGTGDLITDDVVLYGLPCGGLHTAEYNRFEYLSPLGKNTWAAADVNGDGKQDVVYAPDPWATPLDEDPRFYVYLRNPSAGFTAMPEYVVSWNPHPVQWLTALETADLDDDGQLDLAVLGEQGALRLYRGDGLGGFTPAALYSQEGFDFFSFFPGDFDGNGYVDLLLSYQSSTSVSGHDRYVVYWNDGGWSFSQGVPLSAETTPLSSYYMKDYMQVVDANADGLDDLVSDSAAVGISQGNGDFLWQPLPQDVVEFPRVEYSAIGDFDEDGYPDIARFGRQGTTDVLAFCANQGDGSFRCDLASHDPSVDIDRFPEVADLDGDGHLDVLTRASGTRTRVFFGDGAGNFPRAEAYSTDRWSHYSFVGNFDGDHLPDFVRVTGHGFHIVYLSQTGEPPQAVPVSLDVSPLSLTLVGGDATGALSVTAEISDGSRQDVTASAAGTVYSSSHPEVAAVDDEGVVTAIASGRAVITIDHQGLVARVPVLTLLPEQLQSLELSTRAVEFYAVETSLPEMIDILDATLTRLLAVAEFSHLATDYGFAWDDAIIEDYLRLSLGTEVDRTLLSAGELMNLLDRTALLLLRDLLNAAEEQAGVILLSGEQVHRFMETGLQFAEDEVASRGIDPRYQTPLTQQLIVTGAFSNGFTTALNQLQAVGIAFSTSDDTVATIDASGRIAALGGGTAAFTVALGPFSLEGEIQVLIPSKLDPSRPAYASELLSLTAPDVVSANDLSIPVSAQVGGTGDLAGVHVSFTLEVAGYDKPFFATGVTGPTGVASSVITGLFPAGAGTVRASLRNAEATVIAEVEAPITIQPGSPFGVFLWTAPFSPLAGEVVALNVRVTDSAGNELQDAVGLSTDAPGAVIDASVAPPTIVFPTSGVYEIRASVSDVSDSLRIAVRESPDDVAIADISPTTAAEGTTVNISGIGFSDNTPDNLVYFDGIPAEVFQALNGTDLFVTVPEGATSGPVTVETNGRVSNPLPFVVNDALAPRAITDKDVAAGFMLGEIIIVYRSNRPSSLEVDALNAEYGFVGQADHSSMGGFYLAYLLQGASAADTLDTVDRLLNDPRVLLATPHSLVEPAQAPPKMQDPELKNQNHLHLTNLHLGLYTIFPHRGENVSIAVLDTKIAPHLGMIGELDVRQYLFAAQGRMGIDTALNTDDHGTAVAAVAAAKTNTILGAGVAPEASVHSIRVYPAGGGTGKGADVRNAIVLSALMNMDVVNASLGSLDVHFTSEGFDTYNYWKRDFRDFMDSLHAVLLSRRLRMPVIVFGSGNDRTNPRLLHDASLYCGPRVLCVGAVDITSYAAQTEASAWLGGAPNLGNSLTVASFSNFGYDLDLVAPGTSIRTAGPLGGPVTERGTSLSAPQVAGLAALMIGEKKARGDTWTYESINRDIIRNFTLDLDECYLNMGSGFDPISGHGMLYVYELFAVGSSGRSIGGEIIFDRPGPGVDFPPAEISSGCCWEPDTVSDPYVAKVGPNGKVVRILEGAPLVNPRDIEVLPDGKLLIVDAGRSRDKDDLEDGALYSLDLSSGVPRISDLRAQNLIDPYMAAVDDTGDIFVLDRYTSRIFAPPGNTTDQLSQFNASLFQFGPAGNMKDYSTLLLPPRPWSNTENVYYWWPLRFSNLQLANSWNSFWMTFAPEMKRKNGGSGLVFTFTPHLYCYEPDPTATCTMPDLNGAVLYAQNVGGVLEILERADASRQWKQVGIPVADKWGDLLYVVHTSAAGTIRSLGVAPPGQDTGGNGSVPGGSAAVDKDGNLFFSFWGNLKLYRRDHALGYSKTKLLKDFVGNLDAIGALRPLPQPDPLPIP